MTEAIAPFAASAEAGQADDPSYRERPYNIEAEQAVLGAILTDNRAQEVASNLLMADHFYHPVHGRIYEAARVLIERGQIANPVTLKTYFEHDPALEEAGGAAYLARLAASSIAFTAVEHYSRIVHDLFLRRELIDVSDVMREDAFDAPLTDEAVEQIERAEQRLFTLAESGQADKGFVGFSEALRLSISSAEAAHQRDTRIAGLTTGFKDLDEKLGGLHRSDLVILAGRPAMGKTALATNVAFNAARWMHAEHQRKPDDKPKSVAFFSLEMSAEQLAQRVLASEAEVDSHKLRQGGLRDDEFDRLIRATQEIEMLPLYIDDTPAIPISSMRSRARRLARRYGLGLVVVDYIQLMRPSGTQRTDNRVQELSEITQGLKALAKELDVPVLALSQVNRGVEQREDKRPQLADLRESGSIEQDADAVMFVYREQYYLEQKRPPETEVDKFEAWKAKMERFHNVAEVIIGKQRHGPVGTVNMMFDGTKTRFADYIGADHLPDAY